jgi:hypothetical protein
VPHANDRDRVRAEDDFLTDDRVTARRGDELDLVEHSTLLVFDHHKIPAHFHALVIGCLTKMLFVFY